MEEIDHKRFCFLYSTILERKIEVFFLISKLRHRHSTVPRKRLMKYYRVLRISQVHLSYLLTCVCD